MIVGFQHHTHHLTTYSVLPTSYCTFTRHTTLNVRIAVNGNKTRLTELHNSMRVPYVSDPPPETTQEDAAIVERIRARRAPRPLQALDLALLHSPAVADGWNSFLGAVRTKTSLSDDVREIAICRVAVVNEAWYEWGHHAPLAQAAGVSEEALQFLGEADLGGKTSGAGLSGKLWSVVNYTDAMTKDVAVKDDIFEELKNYFSDKEVVEITATVCSCCLGVYVNLGLEPLSDMF